MELLEFRNVTKIYHENIVALDSISFSMQRGEWLTFVGKSGAGKTTILRLLLRDEKPTRGRIFFNGQEIEKIPPNQLPRYRRKIGPIFQDFKLLNSKTAYENVAFAMEVAGRPEHEIKKVVVEILELVGLLSKVNRFPDELSGGEKQRVAIARALVQNPELIIADEPTGNLDPINSWEVIQLLAKINQLGTAIILATHNRDIVNNLGRRVISLDAGKIIRDDPKGSYVLT
jgi:cell division transport system ATP-binding protein